MLTDSYSVNSKGHLCLGGADTVDLANQFGTPLYVFDEKDIRNNCKAFKEAFDEYYDGNALVLYASKAFSCKEMYRLVNSEGLGTDVVSGGELYTALAAGFPAEKIYFHGNNKTPNEIAYALDSKIGRIVVDNLFELETIDCLAKDKGIKAKVLFRIKPGIDAHTHDFIKTGQIDCKFGFALENTEAYEAVKKVTTLENVELAGIHCHIGSQIFETEPFVLAAEVMLKFADKIRKDFGITLGELNLGGGYGIKYVNSDKPVSKNESIKLLCSAVKKACAEYD